MIVVKGTYEFGKIVKIGVNVALFFLFLYL